MMKPIVFEKEKNKLIEEQNKIFHSFHTVGDGLPAIKTKFNIERECPKAYVALFKWVTNKNEVWQNLNYFADFEDAIGEYINNIKEERDKLRSELDKLKANKRS